MMHGHEKSDSAIVATKPPNRAGRPAAEAVERRAEAKENATRTAPLTKRCATAERICWCGGEPSNGGMIFTTTPRRALQKWRAEKHVCDPARVRGAGVLFLEEDQASPVGGRRRSITKTRGRSWIVIGGNNSLGVRLRRRMPRVALSGIALRPRVGAALMVSLVFSVCESTGNSLAHFCPAFRVFRFRGYGSN